MFARPESHRAGNAEQDAGLASSGRPASVGVDHSEIGRELQRSARGIGPLGDFRGVEGFDFAAKVPRQPAQDDLSAISFQPDHFSTRAGQADQAGSEEGESFAPGIFVMGGGATHPTPDVARGRFGFHAATLDLFASRHKSGAVRVFPHDQIIRGMDHRPRRRVAEGCWLARSAGLAGVVHAAFAWLGKGREPRGNLGRVPRSTGGGQRDKFEPGHFSEVLCAVLLVAGLAARLALVPLIVTMAVAFFLIHGGRLVGEGNGEMAFLYLAGFVALLIAGPGRYSFDHYVLRAFRG